MQNEEHEEGVGSKSKVPEEIFQNEDSNGSLAFGSPRGEAQTHKEHDCEKVETGCD